MGDGVTCHLMGGGKSGRGPEAGDGDGDVLLQAGVPGGVMVFGSASSAR